MVLGVPVYATNTTRDEKLLHAAGVLAQFLDNDEDGEPDNPKVYEAILDTGGAIAILGPSGQYIAGPADDGEQILYADADLEKIIEGKLSHDLTGHYNRFDVFTLMMKSVPREALQREPALEETETAEQDNGLVRLSQAGRR